MGTGDFPCTVCGQYWCNGIHHITPTYVPEAPAWTGNTTMTLRWPLSPERLHPEDIEAIAKRVVELLRDGAPKVTSER